jgi:uncharacterized protein YlaN (UPF0358 family)
MSTLTVRIIDPCRKVVATARVAKRRDRFAGLIDLNLLPVSLRQQFEEYEEIVNGQMFSLLDEIEEQIAALMLRVVFEDDSEAAVVDLQVFPSIGRVSFKIAKEPVSQEEATSSLQDLRGATEPALQGLTICLLGTATPAELIEDTWVSPFNIGRRIEVRDFTPEEAAPLASGLSDVQASRRPGVQDPTDPPDPSDPSDAERLNA